MTVPAKSEQPAATSNVRLVAVDGRRQPQYLARAMELQRAILRVAATAGMTSEDLPGLHGMCVEAFRTAERHAAR